MYAAPAFDGKRGVDQLNRRHTRNRAQQHLLDAGGGCAEHRHRTAIASAAA